MKEIVASYYSTQFQGESIIQTQEIGEKPNKPEWGPLGSNSRHQFFFQKSGFASQ